MLLPNKSKHIFRVDIKHYWHFEGVIPKQYYTLFQKSSNTEIFRELLANNTTHFSRVDIKQYWHFQRVPSKLNYSRKFFQSSYHTILHFQRVKRVTTKQYWLIWSSYETVFTLSQSYCHTVINTFLKFSMETWTEIKFSRRKFPIKTVKS